MRFCLALPTDRVDPDDELAGPDAIAEVSLAAEAAGFDAVLATEHPLPDRQWLASGGHHALDPFVALTVAACATSRLRVQTNLVVAGYRNPFLLAKAAASLDVLSRGRLTLGLGAGYLAPEFAALGADFPGRNAGFDEVLVAVKLAWAGEPFTASGQGWSVADGVVLPRPSQRPHPPLLIGGNSDRALRRVVEHGDGWVPARLPAATAAAVRTAPLTSTAELGVRIRRLRDMADAAGRHEPLQIVSMPMAGTYGRVDGSAVVDDAAAQAELGVTGLAVTFEAPGRRSVRSRQQLLDLIEGFGREVVAAVPRRGI